MGDLSTRSEREQRTAAAILLVFDDWRPRLASPGAPDWPQFARDLEAAIKPELEQTFLEAAFQLAAEKKTEIDEAKIRRRAATWAASYALLIAHQITNNTEAGAGDPPQEEAVQNWLSEARARAIGVTETTRATVAGAAAAVALLILLGVFDKPVPYWNTAEDERVCGVCAPLDGQPESVWRRVVPAGPAAHPHCRCWLSWR
jgi:hypothetical protein